MNERRFTHVEGFGDGTDYIALRGERTIFVDRKGVETDNTEYWPAWRVLEKVAGGVWKEIQLKAPGKDPANPKDMAGAARIDLTLIHVVALCEEALAMTEGMEKYGAYNYTAAKVKARVYVGAALRHLFKWLMGEERDPKTGVHHLGSVRACAGILLAAEAHGTLIDDRPPSLTGASDQVDAMEARVKALRELYKEFHPKHFTRDTQNGTGKSLHTEGAQTPR